MDINQKYDFLVRTLKDMQRFTVAFSGGVDSSFLLRTAKEAVGPENLLALTMNSQAYHKKEIEEAVKTAKSLQVNHLVVDYDTFANKGFEKNDADRCYHCKIMIFQKIKAISSAKGFNTIIEGSNFDDTSDYRPGLKAIRELYIRSPLIESGLTKNEIRQLLGLKNTEESQKPSQACLASRIPYGEKITMEKLSRIESAEDFIMGLGVRTVRVRDYSAIARIEVEKKDFNIILDANNAERISKKLKGLGYKYISLDLDGYVTGSMNSVLNDSDKVRI